MAKEIRIYGEIGYDWWTGGGITSDWFAGQMDEAEASEDPDIHIRINSPGGSVFDGIAIYNRIAKSAKNVTTFNDGIAYSMGAVILMSGKKIVAANNSTMMIHNVSGGIWGNAQDIRGALEMMDALDDSLAQVFASKTGLSLEQVKAKWMDFQDHTLSAQKAFEADLIDEVRDYKSQNVPENLSNMTYQDVMAWFKNQESPKNKNWFNKIVDAVRERIPSPQQITNSISDMKIKFLAQWAALAVVLGLSFADGEAEKEVEVTSDHLSKINAELDRMNAELNACKDANVKLEQLQNELNTSKESITALTTERDALKAKVAKMPAGTPAATGSEGDPDLEEEEEELDEHHKEALNIVKGF